jgi:CBS domain-containing protein
MKISEVMVRGVVTCSDDATLADAVKLFWEHDIGFLPVISAESGNPCGVITDRDVAVCAWAEGRSLDGIPVSHAMSARVISVGTEADIGEAEALMADAQVHRLVVIEAGRIVGVVSINDLAREAASRLDPPMEEAVALTLGAIAQPRNPLLH